MNCTRTYKRAQSSTRRNNDQNATFQTKSRQLQSIYLGIVKLCKGCTPKTSLKIARKVRWIFVTDSCGCFLHSGASRQQFACALHPLFSEPGMGAFFHHLKEMSLQCSQ